MGEDDPLGVCETCGKGPFKTEEEAWNHPCPGRETTIQRSPVVLLGYEPKLNEDGVEVADLTKPVYEDRPLPEVGSIMDRPGGRRAKVVSAQLTNDEGGQKSQVIGLRYVD